MLNVVQDCYFVLKDAGLCLSFFETSLVDDLDGDGLIVGLADATVNLTKLTGAQKFLGINTVFFFKALFLVFGR